MGNIPQYTTTTEPDGTTLVWEEGLDIPWAVFEKEEEAHAYIRERQKGDELEEEFKTMVGTFAERVSQELEMTKPEALEALHEAIPKFVV